MNRLYIILLAVIAVAGFAVAGAELFSFQAFPIGTQCHLEWQSGVETELDMFVVERSDDAEAYAPVGQVNPHGSFSTYSFTDRSPLMADVDRIFYYRLKMVDRNGTVSYSDVRDVQLSFSAVQHTWGSIKAMFR